MLILRIFAQKHNRTIQKKDGSKFDITYQEAELLRQNRRPRVVEISTSTDGAYPEGLYTIHESAFRPDDYDHVSMSRYFRLQPLADAIGIAQSIEENWKNSHKR